MVDVPGPIPVTTPVPEPTVATDVLLLLHDPPGMAVNKLMVPPAQTLVGPTIGGGNGFTVTVAIT